MTKSKQTNPNKQTEPVIGQDVFRISAAAKAAGVSTQTIEYYLFLGLIKPRRIPGKSGRFFDEKLIRRIRLIRKLNQTGYTLRDIREIYLETHPE